MICPRCKHNLETVSYENIEVDRCLNCGGIWFDALEVEELKNIEGSEKIDDFNPLIKQKYNQATNQIKCPKCQSKMQKMLDIDQYSIWYEQCTKCRGIWLDAGEFTQFKQNFKPSMLVNLTQHIFRNN
jgi:Zn-finger nucleic acid-binding protein